MARDEKIGARVKRGQKIILTAYVTDDDTGEIVPEAFFACLMIKSDGEEVELEPTKTDEGKTKFVYKTKKKDPLGKYKLEIDVSVSATETTSGWSETHGLYYRIVQ